MVLLAAAISIPRILLASVIKAMRGFQVITNFWLIPCFFCRGQSLIYGIDAIRYIMLRDSSMQFFPLWLKYGCIISCIRGFEQNRSLYVKPKAIDQPR